MQKISKQNQWSKSWINLGCIEKNTMRVSCSIEDVLCQAALWGNKCILKGANERLNEYKIMSILCPCRLKKASQSPLPVLTSDKSTVSKVYFNWRCQLTWAGMAQTPWRVNPLSQCFLPWNVTQFQRKHLFKRWTCPSLISLCGLWVWLFSFQGSGYQDFRAWRL